MKLFKQTTKYTKPDGVIVTKYKPTTSVFIDSINLDNGNVEEKEIIGYSKHENIVMYKIHDPSNRFKDFWVSEDHSMILYDVSDGTYKKESPKTLPNHNTYIVKQEDHVNCCNTSRLRSLSGKIKSNSRKKRGCQHSYTSATAIKRSK